MHLDCILHFDIIVSLPTINFVMMYMIDSKCIYFLLNLWNEMNERMHFKLCIFCTQLIIAVMKQDHD